MINNALSSKVKVRVTCVVAAQCLWGRGENDTMRWKHSWRQWYLTQGMVRSSRRDVFPVRFWPISPVWLMAESSVPTRKRREEEEEEEEEEVGTGRWQNLFGSPTSISTPTALEVGVSAHWEERCCFLASETVNSHTAT